MADEALAFSSLLIFHLASRQRDRREVMSDFKTKHDGEGLGPSEPPATQQSPADRFSTATTLSLTQPTANSAPTDVVAGTHGAPQSSAIGDMVSAKPDGGEGFSSLTLPPSPSSSQPTAVAGGSNNDTSSANLKHLSNGAVAGIAIGA